MKKNFLPFAQVLSPFGLEEGAESRRRKMVLREAPKK